MNRTARPGAAGKLRRLFARGQPQLSLGTEIPAASAAGIHCNVCGAREFRDFRGRKLAECVKCRSLERTRLMKLALDLQSAVKPGMRVLHLAPKLGLGRYLRSVVGKGYVCADLRPELYPKELNAIKLDLTRDVFDLPRDHYDLIIHSHVVEHIPCDLVGVLYYLHRALRPGGWHAFSIPITDGYYRCDFSDMSEDERRAKFGHVEHFHAIGRADLDRSLGVVFDLNPYPFLDHVDEAILRSYSVNPSLAARVNGSSVFMQDKASLRLR